MSTEHHLSIWVRQGVVGCGVDELQAHPVDLKPTEGQDVAPAEGHEVASCA